MAFDLWTDGVTLVDRFARLFNKTVVARTPLSGALDASNQVFYAPWYPILSSGSLGVYTSGSSPLDASAYTVDYASGMIVMATAPTVQPTASYTAAKFSDAVIKSVLVAGFDDMELQWYRGLYLSETLGGGVVYVTEASPYAYVTDSSGSDPAIGTQFFSTSRAQQGFYSKCTQLAFYQMLMGEHAHSDFVYTEAGGIRIDKSGMVRNLKIVVDQLKKDIDAALSNAQDEWSGGSRYGGAILSPMTRDTLAHRYWQRAALDENWRASTPYGGASY